MKRHGWFFKYKMYRVLCLLIILLIAGCAKQRAQLALNKANKLTRRAEDHEAAKYVPDLLKRTQDYITETERNMTARQYKQALDRAKRAVGSAKNTLEQAKIQRAADLVNQAKRAIDIANLNYGRKEDPERYEKIMELNRKALEAREKDKWEAAINLSLQVIEEVGILLQRLRNEAESKLQEAKNKKRSMITAGAQQKAPEYVIEVTDLIEQIEEVLIKEQQNYVSAIKTAEDAIRKTEEGIIKTKERMAMEELNIIETDLALAITIGAKIYAPDLLYEATDIHEKMVEDLLAHRYERVLLTADMLKPRVQNLILITRRSSAEARIKAVTQTIADLIEGGAKEYLPGRVEVLEEELKKAEAEFAAERYEEAEKICVATLDTADKIKADFNNLALDAMRSAGEALDIAQNVFNKMPYIFIVKPIETMTPLERDFEMAKEGLKQELGTALTNSRLNLGIAKLRQEEGRYRRSIELSAMVKKSAEYILRETYHVVAHNAIMELAGELSRYEKQGGREYALEQLERTKILLEDAKSLLRGGKYKEAVSKSAETRAQLELTIQEIEKKAVAYIQQAKEALEVAPQLKTNEYKMREIQETQLLLRQASEQLETQQLKPAVEMAYKAAKVITDANVEATRLWAQDEITGAEAILIRARDAGAETYAAAKYDEAHRYLKNAQQLLAQASYLESKDSAIAAKNVANEALFKKVIDAENLIAKAKGYGGWQYNYELLSKALIDTKKGRKLIEERDYVTARRIADRAISQAESVLAQAQRLTFSDRADKIDQDLEFALNTGASYFQVEEAKRLYSWLADIRTKFTLEEVDYYVKELDKMEAELSKLIMDMPQLISKIINNEQARLALVEEDLAEITPETISKAKDFLRYSRLDYNKNEYAGAYRNLRKAVEIIRTLERQQAESKYRQEVSELFQKFDQALDSFQPVLKIDYETMSGLAMGPDGKAMVVSIAGAEKPSKFKDALEEIYISALELKPPETKQELHKEVVAALNNARLASWYFERMLILDQYSPESVKKILAKAYQLMDAAKEKRAELQRLFLEEERRLRPEELSLAL